MDRRSRGPMAPAAGVARQGGVFLARDLVGRRLARMERVVDPPPLRGDETGEHGGAERTERPTDQRRDEQRHVTPYSHNPYRAPMARASMAETTSSARPDVRFGPEFRHCP